MIIAICVLLFVIAHESGHVCVALRCGSKLRRLRLGIGPKLVDVTRGEMQFVVKLLPVDIAVGFSSDEMTSHVARSIALGGLLAGLALSVLMVIAGVLVRQNDVTLSGLAMILATLANVVPLRGFDGYRLLKGLGE